MSEASSVLTLALSAGERRPRATSSYRESLSDSFANNLHQKERPHESNDPAITFSDIAAGDNAGIAYRRVPSTTFFDLPYGARYGRRVMFPEILCSFAGHWASKRQYRGCVKEALDELVAALPHILSAALPEEFRNDPAIEVKALGSPGILDALLKRKRSHSWLYLAGRGLGGALATLATRRCTEGLRT